MVYVVFRRCIPFQWVGGMAEAIKIFAYAVQVVYVANWPSTLSTTIFHSQERNTCADMRSGNFYVYIYIYIL